MNHENPSKNLQLGSNYTAAGSFGNMCVRPHVHCCGHSYVAYTGRNWRCASNWKMWHTPLSTCVKYILPWFFQWSSTEVKIVQRVNSDLLIYRWIPLCLIYATFCVYPTVYKCECNRNCMRSTDWLALSFNSVRQTLPLSHNRLTRHEQYLRVSRGYTGLHQLALPD